MKKITNSVIYFIALVICCVLIVLVLLSFGDYIKIRNKLELENAFFGICSQGLYQIDASEFRHRVAAVGKSRIKINSAGERSVIFELPEYHWFFGHQQYKGEALFDARGKLDACIVVNDADFTYP